MALVKPQALTRVKTDAKATNLVITVGRSLAIQSRH